MFQGDRVPDVTVWLCSREIEYLKKETAQRRAQEETEASNKEEADTLQGQVCV